MNIISKSKIFFIFSALVIIPGVISLFLFGLKLSIDFTGGSLLEVRLDNVDQEKGRNIITDAVSQSSLELISLQSEAGGNYLLRFKPLTQDQKDVLVTALINANGQAEETRFETIGPTIGSETAVNAIKAIIVASLMIIIYIAWAFRQIPKPYSGWTFGFSAVFALIHDILVVLGSFSLLGHFYKIEIDSLFITALLTVMGFSVHDSIVVFDRIRENLKKGKYPNFAETVNASLVQTLARSLSTSLTVVFTVTALLLFGGESIRYFVLALLIGVVSGTYSSIFNAAPLLVVWDNLKNRKRK